MQVEVPDKRVRLYNRGRRHVVRVAGVTDMIEGTEVVQIRTSRDRLRSVEDTESSTTNREIPILGSAVCLCISANR